MMAARRFPPAWRADKIPGGCVVRDANGQALAYIHSRAKVLTKDEARQVAVNTARLPALLGRPIVIEPVW
jgi:hypothetical protein